MFDCSSLTEHFFGCSSELKDSSLHIYLCFHKDIWIYNIQTITGQIRLVALWNLESCQRIWIFLVGLFYFFNWSFCFYLECRKVSVVTVSIRERAKPLDFLWSWWGVCECSWEILPFPHVLPPMCPSVNMVLHETTVTANTNQCKNTK